MLLNNVVGIWDVKPDLYLKFMLQSAPKQVFFIIKIEKFCAEAAEPPTLAAAGHSFLHLVCGASIFAPSAVTHSPSWKSGYGTVCQ